MIEFMEELFIQTAKLIEILFHFVVKYSEIGLIYLIFFGSNACVYIVDAYKKLCELYPEIKEWVNKCDSVCSNIMKKIFKLFANYRFEPEKSPWISIVWLDGDNDFSEDYFDFSNEIFSENSMNLCYNITMKESVKESMNGTDGIIIMKCGDKTRCNMIDKYDEKYTFEQSKVKFLAIEYKHPSMNEPISIDLDRSWFLCGNQLLSNLFVRRYLDYQPVPFYFDEKYTITIIDNNTNITKVDYMHYVVIEKDTYRIVENEYDILSVDSVDKPQQESEEEIDELKEAMDELMKKVEETNNEKDLDE
jgi:hypothetical protein